MRPFCLALCAGAAALLAPLVPQAAAKAAIKPLPYPFNGLEPVVSAASLESHYRLYIRYVERTNELIHGTILEKLPLQAIVLTAPYKSELYNYSAQAFNHQAQWPMLAPVGAGGGGYPKGALATAINKRFGGLDGLKKAFLEESCKVFANGYVALIRRACDHELDVVVTGDADNPLRLGLGVPVLVLDLWEHAYWLDVHFHREQYIFNAFNIVNWNTCEKLYEGDLTLLLS